jgi:ubiquinone/menaquinone biosynthesis C-methylase UbiE
MERMPAPEHRAAPAGPPRVNDYDVLAEAYTASNETSLWNAYYALPAMLALAGDVAGRRILDAGCGSGPLYASLRDRGALVTGFDSSAGMLEEARRRIGDLEDWGPALAELRRVLKPGGRLIVSVATPSPSSASSGRKGAMSTTSPPIAGPRTGAWAARPSR